MRKIAFQIKKGVVASIATAADSNTIGVCCRAWPRKERSSMLLPMPVAPTTNMGAAIPNMGAAIPNMGAAIKFREASEAAEFAAP